MPRRKRGQGLSAARDMVKVGGRRGIEVDEEKPKWWFGPEPRVLVCFPPKNKAMRGFAPWVIVAVPRSEIARIGKRGRARRIPAACFAALAERRK